MRPGALCISIDLELAWGIWDEPSTAYHRLCAEKERAVVNAMLELFASRSIPATWAIVGRLLDPAGGVPTSTEFGERIWYAPDLVEAIRNGAPGHDIGSHGFAHLYFQETDRDRLRADLRAARRVHDEHGLPFTSFVFPRNQVAHLDLLAEAGIKVFRGVDVGWQTTVRERLGRVPGRAANLVDKVLPIPPPLVQPRALPFGLVELPSSMLLLGRNGLRGLVPPHVAELKAKLGLRQAARHGGIFHLWFHPSNFYFDTGVQLRVLGSILDEACALRDRAALDIRTMTSYAGHGAAPIEGRAESDPSPLGPDARAVSSEQH
jgi:peptidoglycan/xylan/chitin deacetylase (PgdA/CDA1 family)